MPAAPLPPILNEKLSGLAAEIRRLLVIRGGCWLTLAALGGMVAAVGLDEAFHLPAPARGVLLLGWLLGCGLLAWRLVLRPWHGEVHMAELVTRIERDFPGLSERLITLVELNRHADPGNGSRALMTVLAKETDQRTRRLDFSQIPPDRSSVRVAALATVSALVVLVPLAMVSGSGEQVRRFALPWYDPPADVSYRIVVSSGEPVVWRGEPVTLSAYLEPTRPGAILPATAALVVRGPGSNAEKTLTMTASEGAAFHLTLPGVAEDFEYRVSSGPIRSRWHTVAAADPVALTTGTTLTLHPPGYAEGVIRPQVREGFAEFDVLQYGRAVLDLRFSSAPAEAYLEWRPAEPEHPDRVPVRLRDDRLAGTAEVAIAADGTLTLVLIGDRGVRTELPATVRANPDTPPRFEKVIGLTGSARDVRPNERIPVELAAHDDVRLDALHIEYCLTGKEADVRSEPTLLPGAGSNRIEGAFTFALAGKAKEGDTLRFRVRASDNRSVPDHKLGPQQAVFPPTGWAILRVAASARPLIEQEVLGQRDQVRDRLADVTKRVKAAATDLAAVREPSLSDEPLTPDQAVRLRRSREESAEAGKLLGDLADGVALTPDLRLLAGAVREVVDGPLRSAARAVRTAETDMTRAGRDTALTAASDRLSEVVARLTDLNARNEKIALARLDRHTLRQITDDQRALAEQTAKQDAPADELAKKQRDLLARLNEAVARSGVLNGAQEAAFGEQLHDLSSRVRKLAEDQAALDRAVRDTEQSVRLQRSEELARRQRELTDEAARLAERTEAAARLAGTSPPGRQPFEQAVERLTRGDIDRALTEQEKAARELDRLADGLSRAAAARGDVREAARQIARWQDDLRRRYTNVVGRVPDEARQRFAAEQQAVCEAVELLRRPGADSELSQVEQSARDESQLAAEALVRKPADAAAALQRAADALSKLAERMPTAEARTRQAQSQVDELRKSQELITRDADEAVRLADRDALGHKFDAAAARQDALAKKVRQLDVSGHEVRRDATASAADRAAADLRSGLLPDVPISQQEVRRQLDRLRQALDGIPLPDEQADELARLQRDVAEAAARLPAQPTADQLRPVQQLQREVGRRLGGLNAPEAAGSLAEAKESVRVADEEARKAVCPDELRKKAREAANTLARLADRLAGAESDGERVERLARERAAEAEKAKQFERQPANPDAAVQSHLDELDLIRAGKAQTAKQKAVEALKRLKQAGDPTRDATRQQDAADALRRLADEMARDHNRSAVRRQVGPPSPTHADELRRLAGGGNLPTDRDADTARGLARRQRELRDAVSEVAVELTRGVRPTDNDAHGRAATSQQKRQGELVADAGRLSDALRDTADGAPDSPVGRAATAIGQAQGQMAQAGRDAAAGRSRQAADSRRQADASLARAAADMAAAVGSRPRPASFDRDTLAAGGAVRRAGDLMRRADAQLRKPAGNAVGPMRQAADALAQAAEALGGQPAPTSPQSGGDVPRTGIPPVEIVGRLDKSWGELPGEMQSKILQELVAKYGEDYARTIKLYFESLAERK